MIWIASLLTLWLGWRAALGIVVAAMIMVGFYRFEAKARIYLLLAASLLSIFAIGVRIEILDQRVPEGSVSFEYSVRSDAKPMPRKVFGSQFSRSSCSFRAETKVLDGVSRRLPIRVIASHCDASYGLVEVGRGRVIKSKERRVAFTLLVDGVESREQSLIWRRLSTVRADFRSLFATKGRSGSLVPGMVIGDIALQESEFTNRMRLAGLSHLTAVSGTNFSIIATFILALTARLTKRRGVRLAFTLATLTLFVLLVRPSPSVLRAGAMALIVLLAQLKGERRVGIAALGAATTSLLLIDPFLAQDIGFLLSVLATAGIIIYSPQVSDWLSSRIGSPRPLADLISIPFSATLFTLPVVVAISEQFSFAQIPINIIASPVVPWVTITGFLAVLSVLFSQTLATFFSTLAEFGARFIALLADLATHFPALDLPGGLSGGVWAITLIGVAMASFRYLSPRLLIVAGGCIALVLSVAYFASSDWKIYQCDVGQGDALLIRTGNRSAIVIDVGPDPKLIDRCLRRAGVKQIPLLVITHAHADHYGGIEGAVRGRKVGQWWRASDPDGLSAFAMQEVENVLGLPAREVASGDRFHISDLKIDVLWPQVDESLVFASNPGDGSTLNNRSLVLMVEKAGATIFLGGDIEPPVQEILARDEDLSRVDIYKVSHHGSKFRSESFDSRLNPALAIISVGEENNFGHPAKETLDALAPAHIHRTDQDGPARVSWWPLIVK